MPVPKIKRGAGSASANLPVPYSGSPVVARASGSAVISVDQIAEYMRNGIDGLSMDEIVTYRQAMTLSAIQTCIRLIGGGVSNTPMKVIRSIDERTSQPAPESYLWKMLRFRPCSYMRPSQFFRMSVAHVMLRGNFYCLKVKGLNGKVLELRPMDPNRVKVDLNVAGEKIFRYTRPLDGRQIIYQANDVLHLFLLTFDGYTGETPIHYASSVLTTSIEMERHGRSVFKNGARMGGLLSTEKKLGKDGRQNIREALDEHRSHGASEGKELVLEEGMRYERMSMTSQDAQWIEARKLGKADIYEIYGIPHHMTALAEKQSNWGTGVEQHNRQFIQWTLEDYYKMWEDAINCDVIPMESDLRAMFDRDKLLRGDIQAQSQKDQTDIQFGIMSPNEKRQERGMNPREGGDEYAPPPNMTKEDPTTSAGGTKDQTNDGENDEPDQR